MRRTPLGKLIDAAREHFNPLSPVYSEDAVRLTDAAIEYAESIGYAKIEEPEPTTRSYELVDAFAYGYLWRCQGCNRKILGDSHNNLPTHECTPHWTTPPYEERGTRS